MSQCRADTVGPAALGPNSLHRKPLSSLDQEAPSNRQACMHAHKKIIEHYTDIAHETSSPCHLLKEHGGAEAREEAGLNAI